MLAPRCAALVASQAFDTPLGHRVLPPPPGACYPVHRRLPGRDSHPLVAAYAFKVAVIPFFDTWQGDAMPSPELIAVSLPLRW